MVVCEATGPGLDSSSSQLFAGYSSLLGLNGVGDNGTPSVVNGVTSPG